MVFISLTTVTPVTASTCRIDVIAAWNVFYNVPFVTPIAKFFGAKFVRQDQETMIQQAEGLKHNPSLMLIDDADKPAKWYFALKQARLDGHRQASDGWAGGTALAQLANSAVSPFFEDFNPHLCSHIDVAGGDLNTSELNHYALESSPAIFPLWPAKVIAIKSKGRIRK